MNRKKSQRCFDGRQNFDADDKVETRLNSHFEKFEISKQEICKNFQIYTRRIQLKKFLAHYEFFLKTIDLPGDIVELGVYRGATLMTWANFLEIRNMGDRQKQVFGFDNFAGFTKFVSQDGIAKSDVNKIEGGFDSSEFEEILEDAISIFDSDRFIPHKPRVKLVKGNIQETVPQFIKKNPGLRISLLHFDADLYEPTKVGLENFWDLVVPGGVVLFDEYGIRPWQGESAAVDEFFSARKISQRIHRFAWAPNPGGYVVKGEY